MGLRGPGAKPVKLQQDSGKKTSTRPPRWQARGLSRTERMVRFLQSLTITSGRLAGTKLVLEDWQREALEALYAVDGTGRRIVRQATLSLPRKVGKSTWAAGVALGHLCGPEAVPRGEILAAAVDRGQSAKLYKEIRAFALADERMADELIFRDFKKEIEHAPTGSVFEALSADHRTAHGRSPSVFIADELAQWRNRDLLDALETGGGAHDEPLGIIISTRSPDANSPLEELIRFAQATDDPRYYARVWSADPDADPFSEETWRAAIPGLGRVRSLEDLQAQAAKVQGLPSALAAFMAYQLNAPVAVDDRFIGPHDWDACAGEAEPRGPAFGGLDLASGANDLTAFSLFWPETGLLRTWGFIPRDVLEAKCREDGADYALWARQGHVVLTPGKALDRAWLGHWIAGQVDALELRTIGTDRWGLNDLEVAWAREDVRLPLTPRGTGFKDMTPALLAMETAVLERSVRHDANPLLRWAVANASVDTDPSGGRKLAKNRARGRIDPLVSAVQALAVAAADKPALVPSVDVVFV